MSTSLVVFMATGFNPSGAAALFREPLSVSGVLLSFCELTGAGFGYSR